MVIWLSGPTGAGKTTLAQSLCENGYSLVEENIPKELFVEFAANPKLNCESLQRKVMSARLDGWRRVDGARNVVFDRSVSEDVEVFCRMHARNGLLTDVQLISLAQFGNEIQRQLPFPDLIVFLKSEPDILTRRLEAAKAPQLIVQSLATQIDFYSEWLERQTNEILMLDTSRIRGETMRRLILGIGSC